MNSKKLFIHIPKNAGLTVRRFLSQQIVTCGHGKFITSDYEKRLLESVKADGEHPALEHARYRDVSKELTNNHQAFAIVRNPWTKVVSRYLFGLRGIEKGSVRKGYIPGSFEEFLEQRFEFGEREFYWHRAVRGWYPQKEHVADENGNIKCDILRFEHFEQDLRKYFNIPTSQVIKSSNNFHRGNKDPKWSKWDIDYRTLYNDRTIQIVADWYKVDIDTFGFDYDTTATKNVWVGE